MRKLGMLVALAAAVSWGFVYATTQEIVDRLPPIAALAMIYWLGAIALLPVAIWHGPAIVADVVQNPGPTTMLLASVVVAEFFIIWSIQLLGGVDAGLIEISYPVWTMLFLFLLKNERPTLHTVLGALLVMLGLGILAKK
jgi:drug/metabolite transporter (DMT)-like permease